MIENINRYLNIRRKYVQEQRKENESEIPFTNI